ncbi:hypothetical protein OOZ19_04510 [Saccharopolyspora sp. NFXS83]|nr:hypothetical protein [Saccharopolyspora sp. NFXS83]MCX2729490.1 hypothetical protein [Saccharopolyspora sp. NFXS83]
MDEVYEEKPAIVGPPILVQVQTDSVATGVGNETTETPNRSTED